MRVAHLGGVADVDGGNPRTPERRVIAALEIGREREAAREPIDVSGLVASVPAMTMLPFASITVPTKRFLGTVRTALTLNVGSRTPAVVSFTARPETSLTATSWRDPTATMAPPGTAATARPAEPCGASIAATR